MNVLVMNGACWHERAQKTIGPTTDQINWFCPDCNAYRTTYPTADERLAAVSKSITHAKAASAPAQQAGQGEPIGWMKPNESYAPDAFRWERTDMHTNAVFSTPPQPVAAEVVGEDVRKALQGVIDWDAKRNYLLPYRVRDPIVAILRGTGSDESKENGNG